MAQSGKSSNCMRRAGRTNKAGKVKQAHHKGSVFCTHVKHPRIGKHKKNPRVPRTPVDIRLSRVDFGDEED